MSENVEKQKISIQGILDKLASGVSRKEIAKELGLSFAAAQKHVFSHPKLKNRKQRSASEFELVDDAPDAPIAKERVVDTEETDEVATEVVTTEVTEDTAPVVGDQSGAWRE